jgi:hypothetical protein
MSYREYVRLEGVCSVVLGLALALVAFPGLIVSYRAAWLGLLFVPALLVALAAFAWVRHRVSPLQPGRWLTARPIATAAPDRAALPAVRLRRRLVIETAAWIGGVTLWVVLAGSSGLLIFGTGLASAAFGAVQAVFARRRVIAVEAARGVRFLVSRRPGLGTPTLGVASAAHG